MGLMRAMRRGLFLVALAPTLAAAQLPAVNLGFTSFFDGGPPAGPGFYFQEYIEYYTSGTLKDQQNHDTPLIDDLNVWVSLNQLIYQSDQELLLGGKWGVDVIIPLVSLEVNPGAGSPINTDHQGLGDVLIGPYLQWGPIMGEKGPIFMHRIEFQNMIPTGKYDNDKILTPGSNFYSLDPYWAATVFLGPKVEASWRLH
ncbi:MAG: transporter, partial [Deltaproteobacteria bacterium]|nr:transporter [Deltaproteobacteria bacterium]